MTIPKKLQWTRAEPAWQPLTRSMPAGACQCSSAKSNTSTVSSNRITAYQASDQIDAQLQIIPLRGLRHGRHRAHAHERPGPVRNGSHSDDAVCRSIYGLAGQGRPSGGQKHHAGIILPADQQRYISAVASRWERTRDQTPEVLVRAALVLPPVPAAARHGVPFLPLVRAGIAGPWGPCGRGLPFRRVPCRHPVHPWCRTGSPDGSAAAAA